MVQGAGSFHYFVIWFIILFARRTVLNKGRVQLEMEKVHCKIPTHSCHSGAPFAGNSTGNTAQRKKLQLKVQQQKVSNWFPHGRKRGTWQRACGNKRDFPSASMSTATKLLSQKRAIGSTQKRNPLERHSTAIVLAEGNARAFIHKYTYI